MRPHPQSAFTATFGAIVLGSSLGAGCHSAKAQEAPEAVTQFDLAIYKDDFALVRDTREISLDKGSNQIQLEGVSKQLDPRSVMFDWVGSPSNPPQVASTTYELGITGADGLLGQFVGKPVNIEYRGQDGRVAEKATGVLESAQNGIVVRANGQHIINPAGTITVPDAKASVGLPHLSARVQAPASGKTKVAVSYLSRGMSWGADYVATLDDKSDSISLQCWASITNHTGIAYPGAHVRLVAGSPNRAVVAGEPQYERSAQMYAKPADASIANHLSVSSPQAVGDLYTYEVPNLADVGKEQTNRVLMLEAKKVPVKTDYAISINPWNWQSNESIRANVTVAFSNEKSAGLGVPLPAGAVRLMRGSGEKFTYMGADEIADTSKKSRVSLTVGTAFDVFAKAKQTSTIKVAPRRYRRSYEIEIHNEKQISSSVRVLFDPAGPAKVVSESLPHTRKEGPLQWAVGVPAGKQITLKFAIENR